MAWRFTESGLLADARGGDTTREYLHKKFCNMVSFKISWGGRGRVLKNTGSEIFSLHEGNIEVEEGSIKNVND